jgi:hypothetical protein
MFDKIWKEQIVQPTSNVGIFKPKQGFDLEEEEDDCNRQLKEYADKLKNRPFELKTANDDLPDKGYHIEIFDKLGFQKSKNYFMGKVIGNEKHFFIYNEVPEKVACEFLELLKTSSIPIGKVLSSKIDNDYGFIFNRTSERFRRRNVARIISFIKGGELVSLGILLDEYNYFPDDNNLQDIDIDWR